MQKRLSREEQGFTLIELMVVVLIIAILIAIAIPTFLGARKRAQDRAAQTAVRQTLGTAKTIFTDNESYTGLTVAQLTAGEPSLKYTAKGGSSTGPKTVGWDFSDTANVGDVFSASVLAETDNCWKIYENSKTGPTQFGVTGSSSATTCTPPDPDAAVPAGYSDDKFPAAP
ncbi:MAG TPA: prepilin-type N-terminal cleavage/methylation domain-containing protein [Actinomycetota bacterium]|nr:prepilin-type N-terminal cleavage/methylation domain-containing protein [Actinomycetota bacterium]